MDYHTFKNHIDNGNVLYISRLGFNSKKTEDQLIVATNNHYFYNWHKTYVHTTLLYKYQNECYSSPLMFETLPNSLLQISDLNIKMSESDKRLFSDQQYYENNPPLVKQLPPININELHHLITGLYKLFKLERRCKIAKNYYLDQENLNYHANCQTNVRDILLLITNRKIYPPKGTLLIGYDCFTTTRDL